MLSYDRNTSFVIDVLHDLLFKGLAIHSPSSLCIRIVPCHPHMMSSYRKRENEKQEGYSHPLLVDPIMAPSNLPQDHLLRRGSSVLPPPTHHRLLIVSQLLQKRSEKQAERRKIRRASLSYLATTYKLAVSFAPRIVAWVHLRLPRPMCGVLFLLFALH